MKTIIRQTKIERNKAEFTIMSETHEKIGTIDFKKEVSSDYYVFKVTIDDKYTTITKTSNNQFTVTTDNFDKGKLYTKREKTGLWHKSEWSRFKAEKNTYDLYLIGKNEKGIIAPVFKNKRPIGCMTKKCVVYDGFHYFKLSYNDNENLLPIIILCCHVYLEKYHTDNPIIGGIRQTMITTDKFLLKKLKEFEKQFL